MGDTTATFTAADDGALGGVTGGEDGKQQSRTAAPGHCNHVAMLVVAIVSDTHNTAVSFCVSRRRSGAW